MDIRAVVIAVGLIVAGLVHGGIYVAGTSAAGPIYRMNKFTGALSLCWAGSSFDSRPICYHERK